MKKNLILAAALGLFLCPTVSGLQGGSGESTKNEPSKKKVAPKKKTSRTNSANSTPARQPTTSVPTRTPKPAATTEQAVDRERKNEALRIAGIAERTRVQQGIPGHWSGVFGSHPDAQLIITKDGTTINGVLLSEGVRETLRGELLTNNKLMLTSISVTRISGTGNYSPDTIWVELGQDGSTLKGSFRDTSNHTGSVAMTRRPVQLNSETEVSTSVIWKSVSVGSDSTCAVTTTGTPYCWGRGVRNAADDGSPGLVDVIGDLNITMVSGNGYVTCWVTTSGAAYCSGGNDFGQLGNGRGSTGVQYGRDSAVPTAVNGGLRFSLVSVGKSHVCGLTTNGIAYCWGDNRFDQLGNIDKVWTTNDSQFLDNRYGSKTAESAVPFAVGGGLRFATLSAGAAHTCAVTTAGTAYCWGEGTHGELGNGGTSRSARPVAVAGGLIFASVTASNTESFTCGLTTSGAAFCWGLVGDDDNLQLGNGNTGSSSVPVAVAGGLSFTALSAGSEHVCGVTTGGPAYCWGTGGPLGIGTTKNALTPVPVTGALKFASIASGDSHTCGVTTSGALYCWGSNRYGELGGATEDRSSSVPVAARMPSDEDGFKAFYKEFRSAVRKRDRTTLESMMSPTIKFPVEITSPSMVFDYLGYKDGEGWKHLEEAITYGTEPYKDSNSQSVMRVTKDVRSLFGPGSVFFSRGPDGKWRWIRFAV